MASKTTVARDAANMMTAAQAAKALCVSRAVIAKWCSRGLLSHCKVGPQQFDILQRDRRVVRIPAAEVERLIVEVPRTEEQ